MAKAKVKLKRQPPKRTLTKQQAVRHLIHAAGRMIAAGEDPFAIHLLIQSADKILIDLAKKTGRKLVHTWGELIQPEYKDAVIEIIRETSNFFKHANKDHDAKLHVGEIAKTNIFQIGLCIANYQAFFGEWTDHMKMLYAVATFFSPEGFVGADRRQQFDASFETIKDMTLARYLKDWHDDPLLRSALPNLESERAEDLQDTQPLYRTRISELRK